MGDGPDSSSTLVDLCCCRGTWDFFSTCGARTKGSKRLKASRVQGSRVLAELPGRGQTEVAETVAAPAAVNVETVLVEVAEVHAEAIGVHVRDTDVDLPEEPLAGLQVVDEDGLSQHRSAGHLLILPQKRVLLVPGLVGGARHRVLANQLPASLDLSLSELLARASVPQLTLGVEQTRLGLPHVHEREGPAGHEHMRLAARLEHLSRERDVQEQLLELRRQLDTKVTFQSVDAVEVVTHDLGGDLRGGGAAFGGVAVPEPHELGAEVGVIDDTLTCLIGESRFSQKSQELGGVVQNLVVGIGHGGICNGRSHYVPLSV